MVLIQIIFFAVAHNTSFSDNGNEMTFSRENWIFSALKRIIQTDRNHDRNILYF